MNSKVGLGRKVDCGAQLVVFLVTLAGCGSSNHSTCQVQGTVTLGGEKVERGSIVFSPLRDTKHAGAAQIVRGEYQVELPPGTYRVEITANREHPTRRDALDMPLIEQVVPTRYNTKTDLSLEVTADDRDRNWQLEQTRGDAGVQLH